MRYTTKLIRWALIFAAGYAHADETVWMRVRFGTNATDTVSATNSAVRGYVHEILFDAPSGGGTASVAIVAVPPFTTVASVNLATNPALTTDYTVRPRFDATGIDGVALTSDPPERYLLAGDSLVFTVIGGLQATGQTWQAVLKVVR